MRLDSRLKEDLGMSNTDLQQLAVAINQTFGINIHDREIIPAYFDSVESLQDFIARKQAEVCP